MATIDIPQRSDGNTSSQAESGSEAGNGTTAADLSQIDQARRVLVIKLGALGDMIIALGPFQAIRERHQDAHLTLLTTGAYAEIGRRCGLFDEVLVDKRPGWHEIGRWMGLRKQLRQGQFDMVYDLQNNDRTAIYHKLFWPQPAPAWSGSAASATFPFEDPRPPTRHAFDRHRDQLAALGFNDIPLPDVGWMETDVSPFGLPEKSALIVPGSAPHRPEKRWPQQHYISLCDRLINDGFRPVLLGTPSEGVVTREIGAACPEALNLTGKTSLFDLASLGRAAVLAVGNDTGPMHLIGAAGCPSVVLFSGASSPYLSAPIGPAVTTLQEASLDRLPVDKVWKAAQKAMGQDEEEPV